MRPRILPVVAGLLGVFGLTAFAFGGWAVITVDDLPRTLPVGQPVTIAFTVRQHGVTPLEHLSPTVYLSEDRRAPEVTREATASGPAGHYTTTVTAPRHGTWTIAIRSGFMNANVALLPIPAVTPSTAVVAEAPPEIGRRLFVAKGCVGCHVHGDVTGYPAMKVGPELTPKRYQAEYLARLLADPSIARTPGQQNRMPDLELKATEIASLVAFINRDRQVSSR